MDRDEVQRRAAAGARRWRESLTADDKQALRQQSTETRRRNKAALAVGEAEQRQADTVRQQRRLERAQQPEAIALQQERRLEREQQRQTRKDAAYLEKRTAVFWSYVDVASPDECWQWLGSIYNRYGSLYWIDSPQLAHRVMWLVTHGPIPTGLVVDHLCERKSCVSPYHLEPVTDAENKARRGVRRPADRRRLATIPEFTSSAYRRQKRREMLAERALMNWCPPSFGFRSS
ncbi:MAG: HNH endonuclease signature motif containing protein [Jatrophihabitans sp.]